MSHFTVAVFSTDGDYESLLAPFNEQDENYFEFQPCDETEEELKKTYNEVKEQYGYKNFEEYMKEYHGYERLRGKWGYQCNPDAKWDWYQEGGRWNGELRTKDGEAVNDGMVGDIDWSADPVEAEKAKRFWEGYVEGKPQDGEEYDDFWKPEYYIDQYKTKEAYMESQSKARPFAMITSEGEWIETGSMGWFGMSDATSDSRKTFTQIFDEYVQNHPDEYVNWIDCHI